jgi:hypothetical protein
VHSKKNLFKNKERILTSIVAGATSMALMFCDASGLCLLCLIVGDVRAIIFPLIGVLEEHSGILFFTGDNLFVPKELFPAL